MERMMKMSSMLEYKGYHASIEYDAEDEIFVGEVFGIADSLNFHGSSVDELKEMFHQSIDNYLELCKKIGKEPEKEFKGTFNIRISPELHKKAAFEATKQKITLNQYVSRAIAKSFEKADERKNTKVIYIPYTTKTVEWEAETKNKVKYNEGIVLPEKENISYVGN